MTWAPNKWVIKRGEEHKLLVHFLDEEGDPINAASLASANVLFKNQDNTVLTKVVESGFTWGVVPPITVYGITVTEAETELLALGVQTVELVLGFVGGIRQIVHYRKAVTVIDPDLDPGP